MLFGSVKNLCFGEGDASMQWPRRMQAITRRGFPISRRPSLQRPTAQPATDLLRNEQRAGPVLCSAPRHTGIGARFHTQLLLLPSFLGLFWGLDNFTLCRCDDSLSLAESHGGANICVAGRPLTRRDSPVVIPLLNWQEAKPDEAAESLPAPI